MKSLCLLLGALAAVPALAAAPAATDATWVHLRAGPDRDFPEVGRLAPRTLLDVQACTAGIEWCDVRTRGGLRGWVRADHIRYRFEGRPVSPLHDARALGVPIVVFSLGAYWRAHYQDRPWYRDHARWEGHHGHRPGGPKPPHALPPPAARPPGIPTPPPPGHGDAPGPRKPRPDPARNMSNGAPAVPDSPPWAPASP